MERVRPRFQFGFTFVELLVVCAVVGILATIGFAALSAGREEARDARRQSDLKQLQLAIRLYQEAEGTYPNALTDVAPTYIAEVPRDPDTGASYTYTSTGNEYLLRATAEHDTVSPQHELYACPATCSDCVVSAGALQSTYAVYSRTGACN